MPWLLALPGHQQSYNQHVWQSGPCFPLYFCCWHYLNFMKASKIANIFQCFLNKKSTSKRLISYKKWLQLHNRIQVTNDIGHSASGYCSWHGNSTFDTTTEACQPQMGHWKGGPRLKSGWLRTLLFGMDSHPQLDSFPDSKVPEANMGPIWGRWDPGGPHVGPMNFAIWVKSLAPGRNGKNFKRTIFNLTSWIWFFSNSYEIILGRMPLDTRDDKSTLVQVMAWRCQATSHYLSQLWHRSMSPYGYLASMS